MTDDFEANKASKREKSSGAQVRDDLKLFLILGSLSRGTFRTQVLKGALSSATWMFTELLYHSHDTVFVLQTS